MSKEKVTRIATSELSMDDNFRCYLNGIPFTGIEYKLYPNGNLECEGSYIDGWDTGYDRGWYPNGQIKYDSPLNGLSDHIWQVFREWHENGQIHIIQRTLGGIPMEEKKWDKDGVLVGQYLSDDDEFFKGAEPIIPDHPEGHWLEVGPPITGID